MQRLLIIGGNGIISWWVAKRALERGWQVTNINRGVSHERSVVDGIIELRGDADDPGSIRRAIAGHEFDVVVNFRAYRPEHVVADIETFAGTISQYVFLSSASAYQKPVAALPITESTPLRNPYWQYSRDKIAGEDLLTEAYRETGFPFTTVRPSHTYDGGNMPLIGGWTSLHRMLAGKPIVVHGDGTTWWTLTHSRDFAEAFVELLGNPHVIGSAIHITSDEHLTWNEIVRTFARLLNVEAQIVRVASDTIARELPEFGGRLLGDYSHSVWFDNAKIRRLVPGWVARTPFAEGAREIIDWYSTAERRKVDEKVDSAYDHLVARFG
ncbi:NAD-dependent epimerase/dehydratase family protein [Paramicrobacterium chengjingii]|uniref:NAD-dependent epimerase/dehydratase family protein n=1 Tax=Paramicrobacterium chengjingii TaxID=2769067 RepID=A0ABX6YHN9_9MICO|nr:NAD-dependent epimerase/dehydratase family protein [Microbacterium chengjingii]QPZ38277.1 NAD-dependent epimerase/dehydratase family protein [Microbacterium chengjingii]